MPDESLTTGKCEDSLRVLSGGTLPHTFLTTACFLAPPVTGQLEEHS